MSRLTEYIKRYERVHTAQDPLIVTKGDKSEAITSNGFFPGEQGVKNFTGAIRQVIKLKDRAVSILDYGCGKATHLFRKQEYLNNMTTHERHHGSIQCYYLYDPCVPKYNVKPSPGSLFDITICADVMEHIPEEDVEFVLREISSFTKQDGVVMFSICGMPAVKSFTDGINVHITVKPQEWWLDKLKQCVPQTFICAYKKFADDKAIVRNSEFFKI